VLEGFEMVEDLEPPIVPNDVAPRDDTKTDLITTLNNDPLPLFFSGRIFQEPSTENSPIHRSRRILANFKNKESRRAAIFFNAG